MGFERVKNLDSLTETLRRMVIEMVRRSVILRDWQK